MDVLPALVLPEENDLILVLLVSSPFGNRSKRTFFI